MKYEFRYAFYLMISMGLAACGGGSSSSDTPATVSIAPPTAQNNPPTADAGVDQSLKTGATVALDGSSSSDMDGHSLTYQWVLATPEGSSAALSDSSVPSPWFTVDVDGTYSAQLVVSDGDLTSVADVVEIIATTSNAAPVANAGVDQNIITGSVVTLNGSSSTDSDGTSLVFQWALIAKPIDSEASLDDFTSASPKFTADKEGLYTIELTVNDGVAASASDSVTVIASNENAAPMANAGSDQNVLVNTLVSLDGTASFDPNGDAYTFQWSLLSLPTGSLSELENPTSSNPSFTPDIEGTYVAQLVVNDGQQSSTADTVNIVVSFGNAAPVADAGEDQFANTNTLVLLDGSGSFDANGDSLLYDWNFVYKPVGSLATFDDNGAVNPSFTTDLVGSYAIALVVFDGIDSSAINTVQVFVSDGFVTLSKKFGIFGETFNEFPLNYSSTEIINKTVDGSPQPSTVTLDTFRLAAIGGDFTITNLQATNDTNDLVPFFTTISEGFQINEGSTVEFELVSPLTNGTPIELRFSFEIAETEETFSATYQFTSN